MAKPKIDEVIVNGVHIASKVTDYIEPPKIIQEKLEDFRDMKLGFMVHWGLYNQLGLTASWGMVDSAADWARIKTESGHRIDWETDGNKFREEYFDLIHSFNPVRFNPDEWADLAEETGFKYILFTTKHHDGFCMWDTKYSDYKVTSPECPYSKHKRSNIVKEVFDAFRKKGLAIGAYFSKPDWHCEDFWESDVCKKIETTPRPTYDINEKPEKWQAFTEYTHNQMEELVRDYGKIDILWLDGGGVCKKWGYDIKMDEIVEKLRNINPELIVVDRTARTVNENYITPEMKIPDEVMTIPWESCLTIGVDFNYTFDDEYKTPSELISILMEIVCKGGNLALNVSPQPDGRIPRNSIKSLKGMGDWLRKYGEAVYKTRPCAPYKEDDVFYTQTKECIYATSKNHTPSFIFCNEKISKAECLNTGEKIDFIQKENGVEINLQDVNEEFVVIKLYKA